jgi:uncharacterized RDD family membrane protein YckC
MGFGDINEVNPYRAPSEEIGPAKDAAGYGYIGYAGFWRRFGAFFIDSILLGIIGGAIGFVLGFVLVAANNGQVNQSSLTVLQIVNLVIGTAINVGYFAGMESSTSQATLGKMALGIKVTDLNGNRITLGQGVGRAFGKILSAIICYIGFFMAGFTERKQALHDMLASTLVLKA